MEKKITHQTMTPLLLKICLVLSGILVWALVAFPTARIHLRQLFSLEYRTVLSSVAGDLSNQGQRHRVLKVRTPQGLFLEVYEGSTQSISPFTDRIQLPSPNDAFFHLYGQATNLALKDIDGNKTLEILAPTFDKNMNVQLNVINLNPESQKLEFFQRTAKHNPQPPNETTAPVTEQ